MRKFNYVEIISLYAFQILLLLVFFSKINDADKLFRAPCVLRLVLPDDDLDTSDFGKRFSGKTFLHEAKKQKKKFITIYLTGDMKEDEKRFDLIRYESRRIKYTCDTNTIVKVHFTDENTYGQFVELVNMMGEDQHKRYMNYQDDFYILGDPSLDTSYNSIKYISL